MNKDLEINLLLISVFFLPLYQIPSYVCWAILLVMHFIRKKKFEMNWSVFWPFYLFFALHSIGVMLSNDLAAALMELMVKVPLVLFPLVLFPVIQKDQIEKLKSVFTYGCLAQCLFVFSQALIQYSHSGSNAFFYYTMYTTYLHPTYFTLFLNIAFLFLIEKIFFKRYKSNAEIYFSVSMMIFFLLNIYLASARLSQMAVIISISFYIFLLIRKKHFVIKSAFVLAALGVAVIAVISNNRFQQLKDFNRTIQNTDAEVSDTTYYNSTRGRIILLEAGFSVFKDHALIGTGLANYDRDFNGYLENHGYHYLADNYTGPHSQYLETAILLGIPGLLLVLYLYIGNIFRFLKMRNYLAASFILIFTINGIGEYTFKASGILIFCFVVVLFERQDWLKRVDPENIVQAELKH